MRFTVQLPLTPILAAWLLAGAVASTSTLSALAAPSSPAPAGAKPAAKRTNVPPAAAAPGEAPTASRPSAPPKDAEAELLVGGVSAGAEALLEAIGETYSGCSSYEFEGTSTVTMAGQGQQQHTDVPFRLAAVKPAKMRTQIMNPMMSLVSVSDGAQTWTFVPQAGQYTRTTAAPISPDGASNSQIGTMLAAGTPIQRYLSPRDGLLAARERGDATVDVGGRAVRCRVLELLYASPEGSQVTMSPATVWVDTAARLVLRDSVQLRFTGQGNQAMNVGTVTSFRLVRLNQPVADSVFAFAPPPGTKLVDQIGMPGMAEQPSPLLGKPAEEFQLTDLAGRARRLSSLRGKVVLLDFWATWCGPCRREMPTIDKLHRELTPKGLAVVAVNVGEETAAVNAFLKKNGYALPVWLDRDTDVARRYGASAIPTLVVIDRKGKVVAHTKGLHDEASLREMIKKGGL